MNRAGGSVGARQVADAHEKFVDDLAAGEAECFFEELYPFFLCFWVVELQPFFE